MNKINSIARNAIKGPITSLIGAAIISVTAWEATFGELEWLWDGLIGCGVGSILIFTPDSIKTIVDAVVKKKTS